MTEKTPDIKIKLQGETKETAKTVADQLSDLKFDTEELTRVQNAINEHFKNEKDGILELTRAELVSFKENLKNEKEDFDDVPGQHADELPEFSDAEIHSAIDGLKKDITAQSPIPDNSHEQPSPKPTTSPAASPEKKNGFGALFDRLGTALGKLGEMIAGILASIRGYESIQDESLMTSFIAKLSPEAQASIKKMTSNSIFSMLGNKTEITPILGAIKDLTGDKNINGGKMKQLSEAISGKIAEATTGAEVADIILANRDAYVVKEETQETEEKVETTDASFVKTMQNLKEPGGSKLIETLIPTNIAGKDIPDTNPQRKFPAESDKKTLQEVNLADLAQIQKMQPYASESPDKASPLMQLSQEASTYLAQIEDATTKKTMGEKTLNAALRTIDSTIAEVPAKPKETEVAKAPLDPRKEGNLLYLKGKIYQNQYIPRGTDLKFKSEWREMYINEKNELTKSYHSANIKESEGKSLTYIDAQKVALALPVNQTQKDAENLSDGGSWIYLKDEQVKDILHPIA